MISETGETVSKNLNIEDVHFSKTSSLSTEDFSSEENKMMAVPNPMTDNSIIHFTSSTSKKVS